MYVKDIMTPYQAVSQWPAKKVKEARALYFQRYPVSAISEKTGIGQSTIWRWIRDLGLREIRETTVEDLEAEAREVLSMGLRGVLTDVLVAEEFLRHIRSKLKDKEAVSTEEMSALADIFSNVSDPLLRIFKK